MTDYYTQFDGEIDNLTQEEIDWINHMQEDVVLTKDGRVFAHPVPEKRLSEIDCDWLMVPRYAVEID